MTSIVHPATIKSLRSELMVSTALTPTQHKGGIGRILGVAAAIAIPFAAPAIASAIGLSTSLASAFSLVSGGSYLSAAAGSALGGGLVGAGLGAGLAFAQGGNPLVGALGGGLGGGIGGYFYQPAAVGAVPSGSILSDTALGAPSSATNVAATAGSQGLLTTPVEFGAGFGGSGTQVGDLVSTAGFNAPGGASFIPPASGAGLSAPGFAGGGPGVGTVAGDALNTFGSLSSNTLPTLVDPSGIAPASGPTFGSGSGVVTPASASGSQAGILDRIAGSVRGGVNKFGAKVFSGELPAQAASELVTQFLANQLVKTPEMSPEERGRIDQLNAARKEQLRLQLKKEGIADSFFQQALSTNPDEEGRRRLLDAQERLGRAQQAGLRILDPRDTGARQATTRRYALDRSRLGDFDRGRREAETRRFQHLATATGALPDGSDLGDAFSEDLAISDKRAERLAQERRNAAGIIGPLVTDIFGVESEAERKKRSLEA